MGERIKWIDGLKGLACLGVFWHHLVLAFFPAAFFGDMKVSHAKNYIDVWLSQTPFAVILNGNYMVSIFCVLSAVLIALQVMSLEDKSELSVIMLKRYPRLLLPIVPIAIIVYFMLKYECFGHLSVVSITQSDWLGSYYLEEVGVLKCFESLFITIWYGSDSTFSNAFWMLGQLFIGSFLAIILSTFSWKSNRKIIIVYLFVLCIYLPMNNFGIAFVLGVLLAYCYREFNYLFKHTWIGIICLVIGIFLGGYPSGVTPTNIYRFLNFLPDQILGYQFLHIIGAVLTIYGIWNIKAIQKWLQNPLFSFIGKISYSIYILQIPVIFSFSVYIFRILYNLKMGYCISALGAILLSNILLIMLSWVYNKYIEDGCSKLLKRTMDIIFSK